MRRRYVTIVATVESRDQLRELNTLKLPASIKLAVRLCSKHGIERLMALHQEATGLGRPSIVDLNLTGKSRMIHGSHVAVAENELVRFATDGGPGIALSEIPKTVKVGDRLMVADGKLPLRVVKVEGSGVAVIVVAEVAGVLVPTGGVAFAGASAWSDAEIVAAERDAIDFIKNTGIASVCLSFASSAAFVREIRRLTGAEYLVAKIEEQEGLNNLGTIAAEIAAGGNGGLMAACGDLDLNLPPPELAPACHDISMAAHEANIDYVGATGLRQTAAASVTGAPTRDEKRAVAWEILGLEADAVVFTEMRSGHRIRLLADLTAEIERLMTRRKAPPENLASKDVPPRPMPASPMTHTMVPGPASVNSSPSALHLKA